jgi:hypothetical protein
VRLDLIPAFAHPAVRKGCGFPESGHQTGQFFHPWRSDAYVAEVGETFRAPNGETDARLRVIYSNGTESNLLRRSLQRALYKDEAGRRITEPSAGPLFAGERRGRSRQRDDLCPAQQVRSSACRGQPRRAAQDRRDRRRRRTAPIANARLDPTFLMADVEVVATYTLYNINRTGKPKLENLIHRVFEPAQLLDIEIKDRFGNPVVPREWFLVPALLSWTTPWRSDQGRHLCR